MTAKETPMGRSILMPALGAALVLFGAHTAALAQSPVSPSDMPINAFKPADPPPGAASPSGATYIPGIGFRFVPPPGVRTYRYYRTPAYQYSADRETMRWYQPYRAYRRGCGEHRWWDGERCARRTRY
jgi:hypothetical protein